MKRAAKRKRSRIGPARRGTPGAAPGTLTADPCAPKPVIRAFVYDAASVREHEIGRADELSPLFRSGGTIWVNVEGLGDVETVQRIGEIFGLHPLALEDVLHVHQRAKAEPYDGHLFFVLRMATLGVRLDTEQVSIFLGDRFVVTFQEGIEGDAFDPVRERLRKRESPMRKRGADYLAYALIDAVVDNYFPVLERYGDRLDTLEDMVIAHPTSETLNMVHEVKRDLLSLRRAFWPLREAVSNVAREPIPQIQEETRVYLRDVHDHIIQVIDIVETYRELGSGLMDVYLSSVSNRMNEVMKVLTIIATLFIPLTFIAGVYGMNFDPAVSPYNMPELKWRYGYPFSLVLMTLSAALLLMYFRRKGWLADLARAQGAEPQAPNGGGGGTQGTSAPHIGGSVASTHVPAP